MKRRYDALVGLVVVVVVIATIAGVAWARQTDVGRRQRDVVALFRDVGNARVGNDVVVRGVVGGRIQAIELAPRGWVEVRMRIDPSTVLPAEPAVLLNESSLFGDWQATIVERAALRDADVQREIDAASHEAGKLPGASLPGIGKLTAVAGQIAGDVATVADRVQVAFDDSAARELRASIRNVADLSTTLRSVATTHASDIDSLSAQLRAAVASLNRTAAGVEVTSRRIDSAVTSDDARRLVANFSIASVELRHAATEVRDLTARVSTTQARLDALLAVSDSVARKLNRGDGTLGLLLNDPSLYRRTDSLLAELRMLAADVRANPKRYVSVKLF
ncbi:MAG TPA: MlaD family protein [Gemmatimonadaceae bacterium]|nr:MlaD family protein [Gemmatimonadaceae bacterium]